MAYELPTNLTELSIDEIGTQVDTALDALKALGITEESSEDDLVAGEAIATAIDTLSAARIEAETVAAARAERVAALAVHEKGKADEEEVPAVAVEDEDEKPKMAAAVEVVPEADVEVVELPEPVAAAAAPTISPVARAAANAVEVVVPTAQPQAVLIAAADVPGMSNGQELAGLSQVATAFIARAKGLPRTNLATAAGGVRQRYGAALIRKNNFSDDVIQTSDPSSDFDLIHRATDPSRLEGGSLVAAGGWCAPSETLYDLCQYETLEGILDIPEFQVNRGGIRWTEGPLFDDIYAACGFEQTEAEAIAGDCKDCCTVDCPPFQEMRLDAIGLCVKSPILTESAYPELIKRFMEGALIAQQHKVNKYIIDRIVLAAGPPLLAPDAGRTTNTLAQIEFTALGMRYRYRLSQTADIEVVAPFWYKTLVRMDLALENGRSDKNVSDAEVDAWFNARNMSVQWVYDYQDLVVVGCDVTIPADATLLMYPAGTWARGSTDVINMDAVYDSPNLEANMYTALFIEEGILAVQKCLHTCAVTVPICSNGKGVLEDLDVCLAPAA